MTESKRVERVIRFPRPLYGRLKKVAAENGRSANAEVMRACELYLAANEGAEDHGRAIAELIDGKRDA